MELGKTHRRVPITDAELYDLMTIADDKLSPDQIHEINLGITTLHVEGKFNIPQIGINNLSKKTAEVLKTLTREELNSLLVELLVNIPPHSNEEFKPIIKTRQ